MFVDQNQCPACFERKQPNVPCNCGYSEEQPVTGLTLPPGTSLMRQPGVVAYLLGRVLGAGAFGITYLGWDVTQNVRVAIKEYIPRDIAGRSGGSLAVRPHTPQQAAAFEAGLTRFVQEAAALRQFSHSNIVSVLDFINSNNTAYLVMPFYLGRTLGQYLDEQKKMAPDAAIRIILSILDGLRHVHEKSLDGRRWMHRDVKPDNILVRSDGIPMLIDFGAARTEIGKASRSMSRIFTAGYAPYEQIILGPEHQGPWIDVYATAATLYHAITGEPPVDAPRRQLAIHSGKPDPLVRPRTLVPDLPHAVEGAILTGMAIDHEDRPKDAGEFQRILETAIPRRKTTLLHEAPRKKQMIGVGLAAVAAIVASLMFWPGAGGESDNGAQSRGGGPEAPPTNPVAPPPTNPIAPPPTSVTTLVVRVEDAKGNAVAGADVRLKPGDIRGRSRQRGEYVFEELSPNAYEVAAQRQGYKSTSKSVTLQTGSEARATVVLDRLEDDADNKRAQDPPPTPPAEGAKTGPAVAGLGPGSQRIPAETVLVVATYKQGTANPGLRYRLIQRLESSDGGVDVDPQKTFHSGDNVRFVFESNIEGHLYIVQRGSSGNWSVLFPSPQINGGQHVIKPFEEYTVPSGNRWFRFDEKPGDESIRVFLSKTPLDSFPGMEPVVAKQQLVVEDSAVARAVEGLKSRDLSLVEIPPDKTQSGIGAQAPGNYAVSKDPSNDAITILIRLMHR